MVSTNPKTIRSRAWCFTMNNYTDEDITNVKALDSTYLIIGKETGESGTPHLQGYVELPHGKTLTALKKRLPKFHLEGRKGTPAQASDYCKKDGDFEEQGTISNQGQRNDIQKVVKAVQDGKTFEEILDTATSYQSLQIAKVAFPYKEPKRNWMPKVYWYWGPPGTGKSHAAFNKFPDLRCHIQNPKMKWFDGYDRHDVVIFDDLRPHHIDYATLLHIFDRYPYTVETKGGTRQFVPKHIFVTSPDPPEFFFRNSVNENHLQMTRRFHEVREFDVFYVEPVKLDDADSQNDTSSQEQDDQA